MRRSRRIWLVAIGASLVVGVNALAWSHAGAMLRWQPAPERTARPEELGSLEKLRVLATGVSIPRPVNRTTPDTVGLDYETVWIPNGRGQELEGWYLPGEGGSTLTLLFHGYCAQKDSMLSVARGLVALDSRVLMVDFYGSGGSTGTGTTVGLLEALDVLAVVDHARTTHAECRLVLYGQSMGGAAVLRAFAEHDVRADAIVLESTFDRFLSTVSSRFHRMGLPATPFAHLLVFWGGVRLGVDAFAHDPVEYARAVTCPALVLQGEDDPNISPEQARALHAALQGPKRLVLLPKVGHVDFSTSDPERWSAALAAFLAGLP